MKSQPFICRACCLFPFAALLLSPLPATAAKATVLTTAVESEIVIRERNGNSSRIVKQQRTRDNVGFGASQLNVKHRSGTLATSGRSFAQFFGDRDQLQPSFHCQAKGENTADSTAPSGHSGDNVTTFSAVKLSETLVLQGKRLFSLTLGQTSYYIDFDIEGKVEHSGDTSVAHGRIEFRFTDGSVRQVVKT